MANTHKHAASATITLSANLNCIPCLIVVLNQVQHRIDSLMPPFPTETEIQDEKWRHIEPMKFDPNDRLDF